MDSPNRIQNLSAVQTVGRQTPKKDFGDELVSVVGTGARLGLGIVGSAVGANPVMSAAVSTVSGAVSAVSGVTSQNVGTSSSASTAIQSSASTAQGVQSGAARLETGGAMDTMARQEIMNKDSQAFSAMYLQLQNEMQQESRQFNAISNVIKVRHDSAKAAINNVR